MSVLLAFLPAFGIFQQPARRSAPRSGLSEHTAPFDALVVVLEGEAEIEIAGSPFFVKQGQAIVMPANQPHALRAVQRFKMLLAMIREV